MFIILSFLLGNFNFHAREFSPVPCYKILLFRTKEIVIPLFSQKGRYSLIQETKFLLHLLYFFSSVADKVLSSLSVALSSYQHSSVHEERNK